jgi:hypothetical protein
MHQSIENIIGRRPFNLIFRVDNLVSDQEADGIGTLSIDLLLRVDTSNHESLHYPIYIGDQVLMIEHYIITQSPEGNYLIDLTL